METKTTFEIGWKTFWQVFVFLTILLILYLAREAIGMLLIAIVVSLGIDPVISFFEKRKINRLLGTIAVFLIALMMVSVAVYFIAPIVIAEAGAFLEDFNKIFSNLFGLGLPEKLIESFSLTLNKAIGFLTSANISIGGAISTVLSKIILFL